jgi:NAD(P)-dependent dehydrogenase (short-subunit alcohol dehydrogenase family)
MRLEGRVAMITGASRGIGKAIALGYAREGADLLLVSRSTADLEAVAEEARALGRRATVAAADVRDAAAVAAAVAAGVEALGTLDVLVAAAGIPMATPSEELPLERWDEAIGINLTGSFICCQAAGRVMLGQGRGSIITIGSLTSYVGFPMRTAYAASKAGLLGLTRCLAVEWAGRGVRVNCLAPGWIRTELQDALVAEGKLRREPIVARTPAGRVGEVSDMVGPAVFLASDESAFVTGTTLTADGGWLANGYIS